MLEIQKDIRKFTEERDWKQFHTPENLAKSIAIEAGELLECFQWSNDYKPEKVKEELADVLMYCLMMADAVDVDPIEIMQEKMAKNATKYPVDKAKGNSKKYTEL